MRPISPDSRERNSKAADIQRVTSGRVATSYLTVIWSFPTRAVSTASAGGSPRLACSASPLISRNPAKSHRKPKTQHPNHKKRKINEICIRGGKPQRGEGNPPRLESCAVRPWSLNWSREKDLSQYLSVYSSARAMIDSILPRLPGRFPWSGAAAGRVGGGEPPDRRRDSGEMEKAEGGGEVEGVELRGCETRWWALLGLRLGLSFGLSFFSTLFFLLLF